MQLLFDLDGTLTNSYLGISKCIVHALTSLGYEAPEGDLNWCVGPPLWESFSILLKTRDSELLNAAVEKYRERFSTIGIFENEVYPGIEAALVEFQEQGIEMCVATSKPTIYAERIIEHFDLAPFFKSINGAKMNDETANKTNLIAGILERENLASTDVIMIGDRKYDMEGAKANQVTGWGVLWGFGTIEELKSANACSLVETPEGLVDKFAEWKV